MMKIGQWSEIGQQSLLLDSQICLIFHLAKIGNSIFKKQVKVEKNDIQIMLVINWIYFKMARRAFRNSRNTTASV